MKLYILRHGSAADSEDEGARVLSAAGRERVKKVAAFLEKNSVKVYVIYHSVKVRARETALIIAEKIKPEEGIMEATGLKPNDPLKEWLDKINKLERDTMIVGHLPHLSRLVSSLVTGNDRAEILYLEDASALCLEKVEADNWHILWFVTPSII